MPAAGDDGAAGLAVTTAIRLGLGGARVVAVRDSARGGFLNPHRDEGSDNGVDVRTAPAIVAAFAADVRIVGAIGGLRRNVGDADAAAAEAHALPLIVLSRWSRSRGRPSAYCLCVSPPRLVAYARGAARARFGPRLLLVLVGDAAALPSEWPDGFGGIALARVASPDGAAAPDAAVASARRAARAADAVLVLADGRPLTLWRAAAFRQRFDADYLGRLGHREFEAVPAGVPAGSVVVLGEALPDSAARRAFVRRFHAAAGFVPGADATRGFAAAEVLRAAGQDRASVARALRERRFTTVAGPVAFDADGYRAGAVFSVTAPRAPR